MTKRPKNIHGRGRLYKEGNRWRAVLHHRGKALKSPRGTKAACEVWIDNTTWALDNGNDHMTIYQINDAQAALAKLPTEVSLVQAAQFYCDHHQDLTPITMDDAARLYLEDKANAGRRPKAMETYRYLTKKLITIADGAHVHEITWEMISNYMNKQNVGLRTKHDWLNGWSTFFAWSIARKFTQQNPCEAISNPELARPEPNLLTHDQARDYLRSALSLDPSLIPAIAIALFAGLRTSEIKQLEWKNIRADYIAVSAQINKNKVARLVRIQPNLRAWLDRAPNGEGNIYPPNARKRLREIRKAIKLDPWPQNCTRDSFISYHVAWTRDINDTAEQAGNSPAIINRHYREHVTEEEGAAWFNITPRNINEDPK